MPTLPLVLRIEKRSLPAPSGWSNTDSRPLPLSVIDQVEVPMFVVPTQILFHRLEVLPKL